MKKVFLTILFGFGFMNNIMADPSKDDKNIFDYISNNYYYTYNQNPAKIDNDDEYNNKANEIIANYVQKIVNATNQDEHDSLLWDLQLLLNNNTSLWSGPYPSWMHLQNKGKIYVTNENIKGLDQNAIDSSKPFSFQDLGFNFKVDGYLLQITHKYNPNQKKTPAAVQSLNALNYINASNDINEILKNESPVKHHLKPDTDQAALATAYRRLLMKYDKESAKGALKYWQNKIGFDSEALENAFESVERRL